MHLVSVDVGTQSVRAALVTDQGRFLKTASRPLDNWNPQPGFYQQSSDQIWSACCEAVKEVCRDAKNVSGIGFDATCSLVVLDDSGQPLTVSPKGEPDQNVVLWMDHRAVSQAKTINATDHSVLRFMGGTMSPEMQPPKLLWIKQNIPSTWERIGLAMDLSDFLTWRATGCTSRSLCTAVCKWTYQAGTVPGSGMNPGWQDSIWTRIGLDDITRHNYRIIGQEFLPPGAPCGSGVSMEAATELGLEKGTPVATSIIDGHAGGLGLLGCEADGKFPEEFSRRLAIIAGTSAAHMLASEKCIFTPECSWGIGGPHNFNSPGLSTDSGEDEARPKTRGHAQRSAPVHEREAGPRIPRMICGLTLTADEEDLARLYLATLQALAYGSRHIIDALTDAGHSVSGILTCGGLAKNPLYVRSLADATGLSVLLPSETESVLLGGAILAASACGRYASVKEAMLRMGGSGHVMIPQMSERSFHDAKYASFHALLDCQRRLREIMSSGQPASLCP
ncbi:hypothetical protein MTO96_042315 [Rhipicephalus appendiculatus]